MSESKTGRATDSVGHISLKEFRELLCELERLGFVKGTGEFENGNPVFISTREANSATHKRRRKDYWWKSDRAL